MPLASTCCRLGISGHRSPSGGASDPSGSLCAHFSTRWPDRMPAASASSLARPAAACPSLAASLPRKQTGRGTHVFARWAEPVATRKLTDGEVRGEGAFTMIAPSLHPSGRRYAWVRRFGRLSDVPLIEPATFWASHSDRESEDTETQRPSLSLGHSSVPLCVEQAIARTLPTAPGQRDYPSRRYHTARTESEVRHTPSNRLTQEDHESYTDPRITLWPA